MNLCCATPQTEAYGDAVCKNILCTRLSNQECSYTRHLRASDGTPCGNRKWCINGRCVADAKAPSIVGEIKILYVIIIELVIFRSKLKFKKYFKIVNAHRKEMSLRRLE